ncbi:hypothetical protein AOL_s00007g276 [Orbilia oligospora ATCC 24927]|uniref:Uncharacterized protein n=1 Tax=Arthrobotrys oligospora (strain ATCC 24927 / CBS 115.81 / DSM 1491) TaxID=756982 RepID=G1X1W7_ARTOA|nr:hypothetical protein AOL_s00007g276 [Orbilia oligospora ATCC 24927]EGX52940.1 hypothetical protein AOL_s00007g276 [Orbilia oligospora ATCC 24927]
MSTTQEDYFGDAINSDAPETRPKHHHHHRRHKHSKPRTYTPPDSEAEPVSPGETYPDEREYKKPSRRHHRHREAPPTTYDRERSDTDTDIDVDSIDDGKRRRRKKHRHRHRERVPDDASSIVAEPESETDDDRSHKGSTTSSHGRMRTRDRAKSAGESAITALGLGETYRRARSKSRGRRSPADSDEGYDSNSEVDRRSRSRSKGNGTTAQAAVIAAVVEAFRARKEPGGVTGSKSLKRIVEAAVASGVVEKILDRKGGEENGKGNRRIAEAVLAGLAAQRGLNGRRQRQRGDGDDKASRVKDLATSGLIAAAGKKFLDYQRSRSQSRPRGRSDSESPERPGLDRRRSRSMGEALAALGLGGLAAERFGRSRRDSRGSKSSRRSNGDRDDSSSDSSLSDSDLSIDESTEKDRLKRLRRKEIISVALALLATINLGHVSYEAREKRALRKEKVESGRINEDESDKLRNKALLKDATAVGLAILAAAEAVKAFKKAQESRHSYNEFCEKRPRIEQHRRQKLIKEAIAEERTRSPPGVDSSRYYSQPGYMGPPPGSRANVSGYPAYPSSGPIPTYGGRDAYSTRDGREIPVVYPSSVTHA